MSRDRETLEASVRQVLTDHIDGFLTAELLVNTAAVPNAARIEGERLRLDRMIAAAPRDAELCAAFRALMWARSPDAFAPPSEGLR